MAARKLVLLLNQAGERRQELFSHLQPSLIFSRQRPDKAEF